MNNNINNSPSALYNHSNFIKIILKESSPRLLNFLCEPDVKGLNPLHYFERYVIEENNAQFNMKTLNGFGFLRLCRPHMLHELNAKNLQDFVSEAMSQPDTLLHLDVVEGLSNLGEKPLLKKFIEKLYSKSRQNLLNLTSCSYPAVYRTIVFSYPECLCTKSPEAIKAFELTSLQILQHLESIQVPAGYIIITNEETGLEVQELVPAASLDFKMALNYVLVEWWLPYIQDNSRMGLLNQTIDFINQLPLDYVLAATSEQQSKEKLLKFLPLFSESQLALIIPRLDVGEWIEAVDAVDDLELRIRLLACATSEQKLEYLKNFPLQMHHLPNWESWRDDTVQQINKASQKRIIDLQTVKHLRQQLAGKAYIKNLLESYSKQMDRIIGAFKTHELSSEAEYLFNEQQLQATRRLGSLIREVKSSIKEELLGLDEKIVALEMQIKPSKVKRKIEEEEEVDFITLDPLTDAVILPNSDVKVNRSSVFVNPKLTMDGELAYLNPADGLYYLADAYGDALVLSKKSKKA